mgnify:CR=1 FL=1
MNKLSLLLLILLFTSSCSIDKKKIFLSKKEPAIKETKNVKTILIKEANKEKELNPTLKIKFLEGKFSKNINNNQNNVGHLFYEGSLNKIGKYNFSKFDNFENIDIQPIFYKENLVFSDNKGTIKLYDQNQKIIWKKNFYSKNEKKLKPRLNFASYKDILIITDNVAKYYAINLETGDLIWSKNNLIPFNSEIKIKDNIFYTVDYNNTLRAISIKDGVELWNLKTQQSLIKSHTKISVTIKNENIYFNNSIGDITAVNMKSGYLIWQLPTQSSNIGKNIFSLSNSKLVIDKNSIFFSNNKNEFYSIETKSGFINWKNEINSDLKPIVIDKFIITISNTGYLYVIDKQTGNIVRINNLYKDYKNKKKDNILNTGFLLAHNKIYLTNNNGELIIANLSTSKILNVHKISRKRILQPFINNNNIFLIKNGSVIKYN